MGGEAGEVEGVEQRAPMMRSSFSSSLHPLLPLLLLSLPLLQSALQVSLAVGAASSCPPWWRTLTGRLKSEWVRCCQ